MSGRRILRTAQRALLEAMMTVAAAVAERRIRRALHQKPRRGGDRGQAPTGPSSAAGITAE